MLNQTLWKTAFAIIVSIAFCIPALGQTPLAIKGDVDIPIEAKVIDATGKVVMPGFVEAHSSEAMSQANETNPNVPYVSVMDSIDPMRPYFDSARRNGVTSVAVVPGNSTMIGGQASVIKTGGEFIEYMVHGRFR